MPRPGRAGTGCSNAEVAMYGWGCKQKVRAEGACIVARSVNGSQVVFCPTFSRPVSIIARPQFGSSSVPASIAPGRDMWAFALGLVALDAIAVWWLGWTVAGGPLEAIGVLVGALLLIRAIAARDATLARVASVSEALACLSVLINAAWIATYVAATTGAPLRDAELAAVDHALGFSWPLWALWSAAHPTFHAVTRWAYEQHVWQSVLVVGVLAWRREAWPLLRALAVAFAVTLVVSAIAPAIGAQSDAEWEPTFAALRNGTFHQIDAGTPQGLVSLPSFHAVLATLFLLAWWPVRWARWPAVLLNALMLVATVRWGAHYLVDVLAGVLLAVSAAWAMRMPALRPV
jgi:membrane-associated phospholipid phosphatase